MDTVLLIVLILAGSIWIGGYVAIAVVARTAARTLEPAQRVAFFRTLGRTYLKVGCSALLIAYASGAILLRGHAGDGPLVATAVTAVLLVLVLAVGVGQARRMTRLRARALATGADTELTDRVHRGSSSATALRSAIGVLTLVLVVLGAILAG